MTSLSKKVVCCLFNWLYHPTHSCKTLQPILNSGDASPVTFKLLNTWLSLLRCGPPSMDSCFYVSHHFQSINYLYTNCQICYGDLYVIALLWKPFGFEWFSTAEKEASAATCAACLKRLYSCEVLLETFLYVPNSDLRRDTALTDIQNSVAHI